MTPLLHYLLLNTVLTWGLVLLASLLRARGWTAPGLQMALGNREDLPVATGLAGRAGRTAANALENLLLFAVLALVAHVTGADLGGAAAARVNDGAALFFWARVVYAAVYLAGIPVLRSLVWMVAVAGMAMVLNGTLA